LAATETSALESHLARCEACRRQLESLRTLLKTAASLPKEIAPSRDLWSGLQLEIARLDVKSLGSPSAQVEPIGLSTVRSAPPRPFLQWLAPLATAAAIVLLAGVAERFSTGRDERPGSSVV